MAFMDIISWRIYYVVEESIFSRMKLNQGIKQIKMKILDSKMCITGNKVMIHIVLAKKSSVLC
jgi:hypothetical protein